jgi:dTDP-4-dehydrorhamnose 3,5-epimerase
MNFESTSIPEVKIIKPHLNFDNRGHFLESYRNDLFQKNQILKSFVQDNEVKSSRGVLRGLHYQLNKPQGKLVRAVLGSIVDIAVDIRIGSPTFGKSVKVELTDSNNKMLYVPEGFAHGYLVKSNVSIVIYKCTNYYDKNDEFGIRWDDSKLNLNLDFSSPIISEKDQKLPSLEEQNSLPRY